MKKRVIAINLPQFHPFKENDEWWGKGFTEWTNVTKAKPRYLGHYQPHLPADTGFYDLRLAEARQMQSDLAKEYGIYGFCYYHYWFNGKLLMERPVNEILKSGEPDFPFMFCWANENWSRNWDGKFRNILIEQKYSDEDDIAHIRYLCKEVFSDKRYIRINNKPVFAIYRSKYFPDMKHSIDTWRETAKKEFGLDLYIIRVENEPDFGPEYLKSGFDAAMDFQPLLMGKFNKWWKNFPFRVMNHLFKGKYQWFNRHFSYAAYVRYQLNKPMADYKCFPCVSPGWDNSPRRRHSSYTAFTGSTPQLFGTWLKDTLHRFRPFSKEENLVFINAWNEWAEGNYLEPDQKWGRQYLEETKKAIEEVENEKN